MKRRRLIKHLTATGCHLARHGGKHDIFTNPENGRKAPVPRHQDVKNSLVALICRQLGVRRP